MEETELVDETAEAVELGDGTTLQAASDVDDDDPAVDKVIDIGGAPVDSGGLEVPGADKTEPEPEPWTGPFGGHRVRQDHGDRDTDAEAKHMNAI